MASYRMILAVLLVAVAAALSSPLPDSAGIVEMVPGFAYGGIPYGSVSGMLRSYGAPGQSYYGGGYNGLQQQPVQLVTY